MGKHFVLIHGAWHGGWCWDGIIKNLEKAGHTAEAPTMPGHGPADQRAGITYRSYVDKISETLKRQTGKVILAGHSSAGHLLQSAAPLAEEKIEGLAFINTFILPDGTSQFDHVPPDVVQGMRAAAQASPDNSVPVDEGFVRGVLMSEAEPQVQDALISHLVPQPLALFTTKIDAKPFQALKQPRTVIFCKDDQSLPPGAYLGLAQNLGEFRLIEVAGGHEALFVNPEVVAQALIEAVQD